MNVEPPLAIDLFTGLHGWAEGLIEKGWRVVGFDIEDMCAQFDMPRPADVQLVVQDVLTLDGAQFRDAFLIVASPPCQFFSYTAMPWSKAKARAAEVRADPARLEKELALFNACFRIQREACAAAGRHIPLVVENVKGAQPWVGRAQGHYGSYYLWGDVPELPPTPARVVHKAGIAHRPDGATNFHRDLNNGVKVPGFRFERGIKGIPHRTAGHWTNPAEHEGIKNGGGSWFNIGSPGQKVVGQNPVNRQNGIKSSARKFASAMIARIPFTLSRHIAAVYHPNYVEGEPHDPA